MNAIPAPRRDIMTLPAIIKKYSSEQRKECLARTIVLAGNVCAPFSVRHSVLRSPLFQVKSARNKKMMGAVQKKCEKI